MVEREFGLNFTLNTFFGVSESVEWSVDLVLYVGVARTFNFYARRRNTLALYFPISLSR